MFSLHRIFLLLASFILLVAATSDTNYENCLPVSAKSPTYTDAIAALALLAPKVGQRCETLKRGCTTIATSGSAAIMVCAPLGGLGTTCDLIATDGTSIANQCRNGDLSDFWFHYAGGIEIRIKKLT